MYATDSQKKKSNGHFFSDDVIVDDALWFLV
jgi:hypothetical protein